MGSINWFKYMSIGGRFTSIFRRLLIPFTLMRFKPRFYSRREPLFEPRKCKTCIGKLMQDVNNDYDLNRSFKGRMQTVTNDTHLGHAYNI